MEIITFIIVGGVPPQPRWREGGPGWPLVITNGSFVSQGSVSSLG